MELENDEMEKLFDEVELEEQRNRGEDGDENPSDTDSDEGKDLNSPEKKP